MRTISICRSSFEPRTCSIGSRSAENAEPSITTLGRRVSQLSQNGVGENFSYQSADNSFYTGRDSQIFLTRVLIIRSTQAVTHKFFLPEC